MISSNKFRRRIQWLDIELSLPFESIRIYARGRLPVWQHWWASSDFSEGDCEWESALFKFQIRPVSPILPTRCSIYQINNEPFGASSQHRIIFETIRSVVQLSHCKLKDISCKEPSPVAFTTRQIWNFGDTQQINYFYSIMSYEEKYAVAWKSY